ncbi:MAG: tRNA (adenosine(37)-N6)-threonylcarbamoyltransferase complex ATPase subunit type 1 TsaE [Candidatus Omnitrophica bacterium]|nr:tRNA (adenosine(37)-N6)-threonylcarbamoyltransferase complex ATPase subunit type 1 TsaE [Candidatus Omnitrophota bacterium]
MEIVSNSVHQTLRIGELLSKQINPGDIICLFGNLGSGKTVLTKGIGKGLGIRRDKVISSSFILIRPYTQSKIPLYHFDLYRLNKVKDILALGYEEYLYGKGLTVIEWAERLKRLMPRDFLKIELFFKTDSARSFKFSAFGSRYKRLLNSLKKIL